MVIAAIVLGSLAVIVLLWAVGTYNSLVRLRNFVAEAWRQIDVELQRRHDLIPNLVETVKGYAKHEKETLENVIQARAAATAKGASVAEQAEQEDILTGALSKLLALSEAYPQLKADALFNQLQNELTNTEDRIAAGRRFYNANVRAINTKIETFPSNIVASIFKFVQAEYFEVAEPAVREAPTVQF